ncbi:hypothetical protein [Microbacterium sp. No. 7]|uniref:hypothetical protein n=1 Tax=Microbacterium sp. No. 7 TaxID=1714373 RepID=UPI0018D17F79|nr:hypothetical protein [Microbacterium sp. No. 7]
MTARRIALGIGLALAGAAVGLAAGSVVAGELAERNTAEAVLLVGVDAGSVDPSTQLADTQVLIAQITNGYTALIRTPLILDDAMDELGGDVAGLTTDDVARMTSIASGRTSPIVTISVTDDDPERAAVLANALATTFMERLNAGSMPEMPTQVGVISASLLREAAPGSPRIDLPAPLAMAGGAVAGGALGLAIAWLALRAGGRVRPGERLDGYGLDELGPLSPGETGAVPPEPARLLRSLVAAHFPAARVVVLTSTTSRSAEPSAAVGVARAFAAAGARTLLVDADLAHGGLGQALGLSGRAGLAELLASPEAEPSVVALDGVGEVLTAGTTTGDDGVRHDALAGILSRLRRGYDAIVIHAPALLDEPGTASIVDAPGVVVGLTVTPQVDRRADVRSAAHLVRSLDNPLIGAIVVQS